MRKNALKKVLGFYRKYQISQIIAIIASVVMAIINLVSYFRSGGQMYVTFFIFFLFMALIRGILRIENYFRPNGEALYYYTTAISMLILMPYLNISLIYVAYTKGPIKFPFFFMIYGYAFYAFYKLISSIIAIHRSRRAKGNGRDPYLFCLSRLSFISAIYTMISLAANLVYMNNAKPMGWYAMMDSIMISICSIFSLLSIIFLFIYGHKVRKNKNYELTKGI